MNHARCLVALFGMAVLAGCAEFKNSERLGIIQTRLPVETKVGYVDLKLLDAEVPRSVAFVETILQEHGFSKLSAEQGRDASNTAVALQGIAHPATIANLHLSQALRSTWVLRIDHPGTIPDKVFCSIFPPESDSIMQTSVTAEYPYRVPKQATEFWQDLTQRLHAQYGASRVKATPF